MAILRVGVVAEGKSDWLALEAIRSPHGWRGVKAWCQEHRTRLAVLMQGVVGRPLHLLVIHADCSMAHNEEADRPCPPAQAMADALREVDHPGLAWLRIVAAFRNPGHSSSHHGLLDRRRPRSTVSGEGPA